MLKPTTSQDYNFQESKFEGSDFEVSNFGGSNYGGSSVGGLSCVGWMFECILKPQTLEAQILVDPFSKAQVPRVVFQLCWMTFGRFVDDLWDDVLTTVGLPVNEPNWCATSRWWSPLWVSRFKNALVPVANIRNHGTTHLQGPSSTLTWGLTCGCSVLICYFTQKFVCASRLQYHESVEHPNFTYRYRYRSLDG